MVLLTAACIETPTVFGAPADSGSTSTSSSGSSSTTSPTSGDPEAGDEAGSEAGGSAGSESGDPDLGNGGGDGDGDPPLPFLECALDFGIDVVHNDNAHHFSTPGQAWADLNRDGFVDVVLTNQHLPNTVLMGGPGGTFTSPIWSSDIALPDEISAGAVFGDVDNDGWPDLYITNFGPNALFRNLGGQGFEDVTDTAGVDDPGVGETAAFGDFDGDGFLDLYVANNDVASPDPLYRSNGDGSFEHASYLLDLELHSRPSFSASFFDYDLDGDLDLYVANDKQVGNVLWRNEGPGCGGWCLTDVSEASGAGVELCSMGIAIGDYDNDGDQDMFVTSIGDMALLRNHAAQGDPMFEEVSVEAGAVVDFNGWGEVGWGTQFLDYDNDGWLDLYVGIGKEDPGPQLHNVLFHNLGGAGFALVDEVGGADDGRLSWSIGVGDIDVDGWPDLLVANRGDRFALYRNQGAELFDAPHYLSVELRALDGAPFDPSAIGSRIELSDDHGRVQTRELIAGSSLGFGSSLITHFGLGDALPTELTIRWPDGTIDHRPAPPVDTRWVVQYPG